MDPLTLALTVLAGAPCSPAAGPGEEIVILGGDETVIDRSCTLVPGKSPREDGQGDGVVRIVGNGITVRLRGTLRGPGRARDRYAGVGIRITGHDVTLRGGRISGYRVGVHARGADGLVLEEVEFDDYFAQRLRSTPAAEDAGDWLWPHANDRGEWADNYGAAILVEDARGVTVRRCRARRGQNGLILDRVSGAKVYDNDFSFLSGWGVAMWRSSDNLISRNALDFCVRGYSHGVYNRGQDSAGILMFEQCSRNVIAENSATHGGDGFFGFGGKQALGEHPAPPGFSYERKGNDGNLLVGNDFSYAVAHGIEMTFSFDNVFADNLLIEDAICGLWGGYSKDTLIVRNRFERCGEGAYGLERGGVNIEHGERNRILANTFLGNRCGVHLWWDPDEALTKLPWSAANGHGCGATEVVGNTFEGDRIALHLRDCPDVLFAGNSLRNVGQALRAEGGSPRVEPAGDADFSLPDFEVLGDTRPVGARPELAGRRHIVMTEWGPHDGETPLLQRLGPGDARGDGWRLLGATPLGAEASGEVVLESERDDAGTVFRVRPRQRGRVTPYELLVRTDGAQLRAAGLLVPVRWEVTSFPWTVDPREDEAAWEAEAAGGIRYSLDRLELVFGGGGPSGLADAPRELREAALPADRFGTIARTLLTLPAGRWRVKTLSDDGIRVSADGETLVDDWTWHGPTEHDALLTLDEERPIEIEVRHFELDGYAVLSLSIEAAD